MKQILIVEDEKKLADLLAFRLLALGYEVHLAGDAFAAVHSAVEHEPDLILLDITLPGGDGYSVVENLKEVEATKNIPFFFITARTGYQVRQRAEQIGAKRLFEKPFNLEELLQAVQDEVGQAVPHA